jgi:hypothetical protein
MMDALLLLRMWKLMMNMKNMKDKQNLGLGLEPLKTGTLSDLDLSLATECNSVCCFRNTEMLRGLWTRVRSGKTIINLTIHKRTFYK